MKTTKDTVLARDIKRMTKDEFLKWRRKDRKERELQKKLHLGKKTQQEKNKAKAARKRRRAAGIAKSFLLLSLCLVVVSCSTLHAKMYLPAEDITIGEIIDKDRAFFSNQKRDLRIKYKTPEGSKIIIEATSSKEAAKGHNDALKTTIETAVQAAVKGAVGK